LIGGASAGAQNVISGNGTHGVQITGTGASNNRIEGNRIGTDADGTTALGNLEGVVISGASGNFVGGPEVGAGNVISGNTVRGVVISSNSANNRVHINYTNSQHLKVRFSATLGQEPEVEVALV
jgi:hypothetical protein